MAHFFKAFQYGTDHPLCGRIGPCILGILSLQLPQAALQFIVFKVGNFRRILVVIPPCVIKQLFGKLLHLLLDFLHDLHAPVAYRW